MIKRGHRNFEAVDYLLTQDFVPNRTIYFVLAMMKKLVAEGALASC